MQPFELHVKAKGDAQALRPEIEATLGRRQLEYELRTASPEELSYEVKIPFGQDMDRLTNGILRLKPEGELAVDWEEKKVKK
jgi:hypothetical protein